MIDHRDDPSFALHVLCKLRRPILLTLASILQVCVAATAMLARHKHNPLCHPPCRPSPYLRHLDHRRAGAALAVVVVGPHQQARRLAVTQRTEVRNAGTPNPSFLNELPVRSGSSIHARLAYRLTQCVPPC